MAIRHWLLGCLVLASMACFDGPVRAQEKVSIGMSSASFGTASVRVAKELGLFRKHSLDASIVAMDSPIAATTALIAGSLDVALSGTNELIIANLRGRDVLGVVKTYEGFATTVVLKKSVAESSGVTSKDPVQKRLHALDGVLIASSSPTSLSTTTLRQAGERAGAHIRFTHMAQNAMPAALESGAVQGFIASAPYWSQPVLNGTGEVWVSGPAGEFDADLVASSSGQMQVTRAFATSKPQVVKAVVATLSDLAQMIKENPDAVKAAVVRVFPDLNKDAVDLLSATELPAWTSAPVTVEDLKRDIEYAKASNSALTGWEQLDPPKLVWSPSTSR
jgi:ABC-type nitrate/sulfonate/bicarbonate transport system substrate-binding protein